jgi:hypothetical protein
MSEIRAMAGTAASTASPAGPAAAGPRSNTPRTRHHRGRALAPRRHGLMSRTGSAIGEKASRSACDSPGHSRTDHGGALHDAA